MIGCGHIAPLPRREAMGEGVGGGGRADRKLDRQASLFSSDEGEGSAHTNNQKQATNHESPWQFKVFTCDRLNPDSERQIIEAWHAHMAEVQARLWPEGNPLVFHWSHAETSTLNTAYNSARKRHDKDWPDLNWYDFLNKVAKEEPLTVKHAMAFGLKAIAKAMHKNGLIETEWSNGPTDGLGAMVGAWSCEKEAQAKNLSMRELQLMKEIEDYNQVDCKVMWEIVSYLRAHH